MKVLISIIFFSLLSGVATAILDQVTDGTLPVWVAMAMGIPFGLAGFMVGVIWEDME